MQDVSNEAVEPADSEELTMFDGPMSYRMFNDPNFMTEYVNEHARGRLEVGRILRRIDLDAANAYQDELEEQARERERVMLEQIRMAPQHSGMREDGAILEELARVKPHVFSRRIEQVFRMCIQDQMSIRQCAEALGIGTETVRTYLRRLRAEVPPAWRAQQPA